MSDTIIKVENLYKEYRLGSVGHGTIYRDLQTWFAKALGQEDPNSILTHAKRNTDATEELKQHFLALNDISFSVKEGEVLGIIGRNGAGKSTLLKILSRVTSPTSGKITIDGRIASLLEVGTGFHPELTGRENIFLNGAILGMKSREINKKLDEIIAFAELEKFIDTPVKRYSSGMYVRLAFAVAAHLDAEILLMDEVLAVGDVEFQKKCLGKMDNLAKKQGRTILFVSHHLNAISQLCTSCILLEKGQLEKYSKKVSTVIKEYTAQGKTQQGSTWSNSGNEYDNPYFQPLKIKITNKYGNAQKMPRANDEEAWIFIEGEVKEKHSALTIGYAIYSEDGTLLYWSYQTDLAEKEWPTLKKGRCILKSKIPNHFLNEGVYRIEFIGVIHYVKWLYEPGISAPAVFLSIQGGLSKSPYWMIKRPGINAPIIPWEVTQL